MSCIQSFFSEGNPFILIIILLWSPYGIGQTIIFLPFGFFLLFFLSSPNLGGRRLDVYHIKMEVRSEYQTNKLVTMVAIFHSSSGKTVQLSL